MKTFTLIPFVSTAALAQVIPFTSETFTQPEPFGQAPFGEVVPFSLPRDPAAIEAMVEFSEVDFAEIIAMAA